MRNKIELMIAVFLLVTLGVVAAPLPGDEPGSAPLTITPSISAAMKHFAKLAPPPKTANKGVIAGNIDLRFPEFSSSTGSNAAVMAINKAIQTRLLTLLDDKTSTTVEQLMEIFIKGYEKSLKDAPIMPGGWSLRFEATIRHADENLLCLKILNSVFTGGAHPTSNIAYLVFSMKTGEQIQLTTLIPENKMDELTKVAEKHFRQIRNLKPSETYEKAGFHFKQNRFALNRNFLVSKEGLAFCFNQYEIAPYSMGVSELIIPWIDLKTIANVDGPAGGFLKEQ
ncbi:MAG: DUF3298 domain-containing protein [Candidatus Ozemobacteraceae bacterium]